MIWLTLYWVLKINSEKSLRLTLLLFLTASFLKLLGVTDVTEFFFKLSLISLIIGVIQAAFELRKRE